MDLLKNAKKTLRKEMAEKLAKLTESEIERQTKLVVEQVKSSSWFKSSKRLSVYVSTTGEVKTDEIIKTALKDGKQVFIPWFQKRNPRMRMLRLESLAQFESLTPTLWDIRQFQTLEDHTPYEEVGPIDLVIAPGVAFTRDGKRLGHGMAYYDKFFVEHKTKFNVDARKVCLALNEQIVYDLPMGDNDVVIDEIITAE